MAVTSTTSTVPIQTPKDVELNAWTPNEKLLFRVLFIFIAMFCIPLDAGFYTMLWNFDYPHLNYRHLTEIVAFFNPQFISHFSESGFFGTNSYVNLPFVLLLAVLGGLLWTLLDSHRPHYKTLYYWLMVMARYRVAYAAIGWGFKKLFVMQMPVQNEGLWHTELIDFFAKRLYWESISIAPHYEVFLGFAEFIGGFLLLFRRYTGVGAAITLAVFGNIAIANHAYDIGEHVPSACMAMLSIFILCTYMPAVWQLVVKEQNAVVTPYYPHFNSKWLRYSRLALKYAGNFVFVVLFAIFEIYGFTHNDFYKIPNTPGLANAKGYYHVTAFSLNGKLLPYSPTDSIRWQDATLEDWSSLSFKVTNRPQQIAMFAAGSYPKWGEVYDNQWHFQWEGDIRRYPKGKKKHDAEKRDINIDWEEAGMAGRQWYYYKADTVKQILYLQNKNRGNRQLKQVLHYERPTANRIVFSGTNEFNDSIHVVLDRVVEKLPLHYSITN